MSDIEKKWYVVRAIKKMERVKTIVVINTNTVLSCNSDQVGQVTLVINSL